MKEKLGVTPSQVVDYKALCGDPSDNIPGVQGVGPKTCTELLGTYKTLEGIYEHLSEISGKVRDRLEKNRDSAFLSKRLATLVPDVAINFDLSKCQTGRFSNEKILDIFNELEFTSLSKRITELDNHSPHPSQTKPTKDDCDSQMRLIF